MNTQILKMESVTNTIKVPHYNPKLKQWEILWNDDSSFGGAWGNSEEEVTEKFKNIMCKNNESDNRRLR